MYILKINKLNYREFRFNDLCEAMTMALNYNKLNGCTFTIESAETGEIILGYDDNDETFWITPCIDYNW